MARKHKKDLQSLAYVVTTGMLLPTQSRGARRRWIDRQDTLTDFGQVSPQVMQDPSRRPPVIVKSGCAVVCFYYAGRYHCKLLC
jgi:hypothetical protein